jgi:streptogramin lyase
LAVDDDGNLWVVDTLNQRVQRFDASGQATVFGEKGEDDGQFADPFSADYQNHDGPWGIAVAADGTFYVADTWHHVIQKFDASGKFVARFGATEELGLFGPRDIDIDQDGNLLVVDTGNKRIVKLSPTGGVIQSYSTADNGDATPDPGEFDEPTSLAIAANGDIYVADIWNQRIQHFDRDFNYIDELKVSGWGSHGITDKAYILALPDGHILATDPANGHILVYTPGQQQPKAWRLPPEAGASRPTGLAIDRQGRVYFSDGAASVIRRFPLTALVPAQ